MLAARKVTKTMREKIQFLEKTTETDVKIA